MEPPLLIVAAVTGVLLHRDEPIVPVRDIKAAQAARRSDRAHPLVVELQEPALGQPPVTPEPLDRYGISRPIRNVQAHAISRLDLDLKRRGGLPLLLDVELG